MTSEALKFDDFKAAKTSTNQANPKPLWFCCLRILLNLSQCRVCHQKQMVNCVFNIGLTLPVPMELLCSSTHFVAPKKNSFSTRNHGLVKHFKSPQKSKADTKNGHI